jgi:processive 1,2-diacylglycerol beta-glucosyltransferase
MPQSFLIVSASMGAGHDGAARELQSRLHARGHDAVVIDYLEMAPFGLLHGLRRTYEFLLRHAPWTYAIVYRFWFLLPFLYHPFVMLNAWLARRRMRVSIDSVSPDAVISTYCLATLTLGRMRKKRWLKIPAITYVTDMAVHPLCVHRNIDLTLTISEASAEEARALGAANVIASGPLVPERFRVASATRAEVREAFNIDPNACVALVVAGSWGVGQVVDTVRTLAAVPGVHPVAVCGRDEALRTSLANLGVGTTIGWTSQMAELMHAADVLVENAGGLTCMEAFAAGLPVVTFRPIPGHGIDNAAHMDAVGLTRFVRHDNELQGAIESLATPTPTRATQLAAASALFAHDAADLICDLVGATSPVAIAFRRPRPRRVLRAAAVAAVCSYGVLTIGAQAATARGVGVARAPHSQRQTVFLGVRLTDAQAGEERLAAILATMHASAIVDARTAGKCESHLRALKAAGVDIASGGWGRGDRYRWNRARFDIERSDGMLESVGVEASAVVPGRRIDAFDLIYSARAHQRIVRPNAIITNPDQVKRMQSGQVYMVDGRNLDAESLIAILEHMNDEVGAKGLKTDSLEKLV